MHPLIVGIDVGSVAVSLAVIGGGRQVVDQAYAFHHGDAAGTLKCLLAPLDLRGGVRVAVTGAAPGAIRAHGRYDSLVSLITGCRADQSDVGSILHVGGERFGLVQFDAAGRYTRYQTNTTCAAGTGGFLDQQARRLNLSGPGELAAVALRSTGEPPKIATRCAVFAKTDLAHAQQEGFSLPQICDGLCRGVARHIVDSLVRGEPARTPVVFSGGVSRNRAVVEHLNRLLGTELICEKSPSAAAGAALCLLDDAEAGKSAPFGSLDEIVRPEPQGKVYAFAPLELKRSSYPDFSGGEPYRFTRSEADRRNPVEVEIFAGWGGPAAGDCQLGIDVGSTSTKAALVASSGAVAAGFYTRTAGNPIGAVQNLLAAVEDAAGRRKTPLKISGAAVTGAGRKLAGRVLGADLVLDEITAHARAACELKPDVDTIIEIGGQDSKFTTLKDGRVNSCVMNTVCAAGTGSFIEEQAQKLACPLGDYASRALSSPAPMASDRCTVFMERDINHLLSEGYAVREILATVLHSIAENYLSKVAAEKHIGDVVCFQGATAKNQALVAAFEQRLGKPIHVSRFCHLTGALGAALVLADAGRRVTRFRGLDLCRRPIPTQVEICSLCANHCKITVADIGGERVASGFLCGRDYDAASRVDRNRSGFSLLKERRRAFAVPAPRPETAGPTLGLPAALHLADDLEFWQVFFDALSVRTITSERPSPRMASGKAGAEFCAPMAALKAEVDCLLPRVDHVFLPFYLERRTGDAAIRRQYCYYTQYAPALAADGGAAAPADDRRVLTPLVHYLYGSLHSQLQLYRMLRSIGLTRIGFSDVYRAYDRACRFKDAAVKRLRRRYRQETAGARDIHVVLLGRPYTVLSRQMNKGIPDIFGALGVKAFFQDMLPDDRPPPEALAPMFKEIHWHHAAAILRAAETAAVTEGVYPVLVTAFRCTPDAFVIEFFKSIMDAHRKPYLILQLDEHASSVGYETRIEAAVRSFQNHHASRLRPQPVYSGNLFPRSSSAIDRKTLLLPDWDHLSFRLVAANLKREGIDARLLQDTPQAIRRSLRRNSGQCIPVNIVVQNFIEYVSAHGLDPSRCLLWMVPGSIACNLRLYPYFAQNLLAEHGGGFEKARIYLGSLSFAEISMRLPVNTYLAYMLGGLIRKIGCKLRPYETAQGATDAAIEAGITLLESAFGGDAPKEEAVRKVAGLLAAVPVEGSGAAGPGRGSRPKVAVFGDLYSRDNDILNQGLIHFIERHGGEVVTLPYSSYVKMIAWPYMRKWFIEGDYMEALTGGALLAAVSRLERKYRRPLDPLLNEPEPVYDDSPERILGAFGLRLEHTGESMDNLLKIHYALKYHPDLALLVQASPAFCCPAMVTEAMAQRIERVTGVPLVSITYDGIGGGKNDVIVPYLKYPRPQPAVENARKTY